MSAGGKGSRPRPFSVPLKQFDNNWDAIFGKKKNEDTEKNPTNEQSPNNNNSEQRRSESE